MSSKTINIIFWISTVLIVIFEGIIPVLSFQTELAKEGIRHLGYPDYFGVMLVGFRVVGVVILIFPQVPARIKEWAYAGFVIEFLSASISYLVVDGLGFYSFLPIIIMAVLLASYFSFHKKQKIKSI
ncbi:MAG TPA: DoxX family protein [Chitinophagaceae bacterium]|jgi:hypothetical protein|nr:DoxX family protein [Chitinophagaceae bacterium]